MPRKKAEVQEKEPTISIFDPSRNAYFEAPISIAKKFIESAKEVEKQLAEMEEE